MPSPTPPLRSRFCSPAGFRSWWRTRRAALLAIHRRGGDGRVSSHLRHRRRRLRRELGRRRRQRRVRLHPHVLRGERVERVDVDDLHQVPPAGRRRARGGGEARAPAVELPRLHRHEPRDAEVRLADRVPGHERDPAQAHRPGQPHGRAGDLPRRARVRLAEGAGHAARADRHLRRQAQHHAPGRRARGRSFDAAQGSARPRRAPAHVERGRRRHQGRGRRARHRARRLHDGGRVLRSAEGDLERHAAHGQAPRVQRRRARLPRRQGLPRRRRLQVRRGQRRRTARSPTPPSRASRSTSSPTW